MRVFSFILAACITLSGITWAAPDPPPGKFSFVAVRGSHESPSGKKVFEKGLKSVRRDIERLNYSSFSRISSASAPIPFGKTSTFMINQTYTLIVEPSEVDQQGRIRMKIQVMMKKKTKDGLKTIKALETVPWMAPGKRINIGGLKLKEGGDLIIVLSIQ